MRVCKNCGEINENNANVCINCGQRDFAEAVDAVCPSCHARINSNAHFCTACGAKLTVDYDSNGVELPAVKNDEWASGAVMIKDSLMELYDERNERIVDAKETFDCPNCHSELPISTAFCTKCGTPVASAIEHKVVRRKICVQCSKPNLLTSPYCSYCFSSLADAPEQEFQLAFEQTMLSGSPIKQAVYQSGESKKLLACSNCGTLNDLDKDFCVKCGLKLVIEEPKNYCPVCGAENPFDSTFCSTCQYSFTGTTPENQQGVWKCDCGTANEAECNFCTNCGKKRV